MTKTSESVSLLPLLTSACLDLKSIIEGVENEREVIFLLNKIPACGCCDVLEALVGFK